jgi:hypothetical protein
MQSTPDIGLTSPMAFETKAPGKCVPLIIHPLLLSASVFLVIYLHLMNMQT